jgi:hypothetical protein
VRTVPVTIQASERKPAHPDPHGERRPQPEESAAGGDRDREHPAVHDRRRDHGRGEVPGVTRADQDAVEDEHGGCEWLERGHEP